MFFFLNQKFEYLIKKKSFSDIRLSNAFYDATSVVSSEIVFQTCRYMLKIMIYMHNFKLDFSLASSSFLTLISTAFFAIHCQHINCDDPKINIGDAKYTGIKKAYCS